MAENDRMTSRKNEGFIKIPPTAPERGMMLTHYQFNVIRYKNTKPEKDRL